MSDLPEDEITVVAETMILDAELHNAAAGLVAAIPQWLRDLNDAHEQALRQFHHAGQLAATVVFEAHSPVLEDGYVGCTGCDHIYPCPTLRGVHDGTDVWDELVKHYPEGWDAEAEEEQ